MSKKLVINKSKSGLGWDHDTINPIFRSKSYLNSTN